MFVHQRHILKEKKNESKWENLEKNKNVQREENSEERILRVMLSEI